MAILVNGKVLDERERAAQIRRAAAVNRILLELAVVFLASVVTARAGSPTPPTFAARYDYSTCSNSYFASVTAADVNGDGVPDLICAAGVFGGLATLVGNGDGTFRDGPVTAMAGGGGPVALDLNGDGKTDVIVIVLSGGKIAFQVCFGNGDGSFQPGTIYPTGSDILADYLVTGDFNRDGITDFAALTDVGVWSFSGKGGGVFNVGVLTPLNSSWQIGSLAAVDLNEDGKLDLVATIAGGFAVLFGNGDGTFQPEVDTATPVHVGCFAIGDYSGDGHADLFLASQQYTGGFLYLGRGDGTLQLARQVYLGSAPFTVAAADVNGDGSLDLITSTGGVLFGNGRGYFGSPVYYPIPSSTSGYSVLPVDLRKNGRIDLVFTLYLSQGISVLLNQGRGRYQEGKTVPVSGGGAYCAVSADFNRDGEPDLALGVSSGLSILLGTGRASSPYTQGQTISYSPYSCPVEGDLNGDGIPDVLVTTGDGFAVAYLGNGDGTFRAAAGTPLSANGTLAVGDFNGDGKLDFALTSNLLAYGNGDGTFQTPAPYIPQVKGNTMVGIAAGRLRGGARSDIVLTDWLANLVYVLLNNGHGGFTQTTFDPSYPGACTGPTTPVLADLNGDGKKDLLIGCDGSSVPIYLNNGSGGFTYNTRVDYGNVAHGAVPLVRDLNGDGILDIVVQGNGSLGIFTGEGALTYSAPLYIGSGAFPGPVLAVNAHGQRPFSGKPDLLTPDASGVINVFFNTTQ